MDVTSFYANIPQDEGITKVCEGIRQILQQQSSHSVPLPKQILSLILKENSFQFNGENYPQVHRAAMGTKMVVAFANIFMAEIETKMLNKSRIKPKVWKRYIDWRRFLYMGCQ